MSFWNLDDGTSAVSDDKEYSAGGGDFDVIPKGSSVLTTIEDASWKEGYQVSETFVNLKVRVLKPEAYANRVLFFKLWIDDLDPGVKTGGSFDRAKAVTKRDKHKRMLMAIDANAKGRLAKLAARPTDDQLAVALVGAQFVATLGVWDKTDDDGKKTPGGNWLMAAKPKSSAVSEVEKPVQKRSPAAFADDLDDDVPF
jgi:hypothetical protein